MRSAPGVLPRVPMAQAWLDGTLDLDSLITDRLSLDQLNEGFAALKRGAAIRSVVMFA